MLINYLINCSDTLTNKLVCLITILAKKWKTFNNFLEKVFQIR